MADELVYECVWCGDDIEDEDAMVVNGSLHFCDSACANEYQDDDGDDPDIEESVEEEDEEEEE